MQRGPALVTTFVLCLIAGVAHADPSKIVLDRALAELAQGRAKPALAVLVAADKELRAPILKGLEAAFKASKDVDEQVRLGLLENAYANLDVAKEQRIYIRRPLLTTACAKYEQVNGTGTCNLRALRMFGEPAGLLNMAGAKVSTTLSEGVIAKAQAPVLPLIRECLVAIAAEYSDLFENATVTIEWGIDQNGQAVEANVEPTRFRKLIGGCVNERLSWLRYPRYTSVERKAVHLDYDLTAIDRYKLVQMP
jgi:hypothetical protein